VTYPIEFICLSLALFTVLDRMRRFVMPEEIMRARIAVAAAVVGNVVGLCGSVASSADHVQTSISWRKVSSAFASNSTDFESFRTQARELTERSASTASIYYFSEVVVLIIIVVCFSYVGFKSARQVATRLQQVPASSDAAAVGKELHTSITATTVFVFATFLLRLVYSVMFALAHAMQDSANLCPSSAPGVQNYCSPCFNVYAAHARAPAFPQYTNVTRDMQRDTPS
jgi:hypothetical protein